MNRLDDHDDNGNHLEGEVARLLWTSSASVMFPTLLVMVRMMLVVMEGVITLLLTMVVMATLVMLIAMVLAMMVLIMMVDYEDCNDGDDSTMMMIVLKIMVVTLKITVCERRIEEESKLTCFCFRSSSETSESFTCKIITMNDIYHSSLFTDGFSGENVNNVMVDLSIQFNLSCRFQFIL